MNDGNVCVLVVLLTEPLIKKSSELYQVSEGGDIFFVCHAQPGQVQRVEPDVSLILGSF